MKKILTMILFLALAHTAGAQKFAIKSNLLYDATGTINLGFEGALGKQFTLDVSGNYNGWSYGDARLRHWLAQPEFRYWFCESFNGHFIGLHGHVAEYNVGGFNFLGLTPDMKDYRYQGNLWGAGVSYGYQWILSDFWNLELTIGAGYARLDDRKYPIADCGDIIKRSKKDYWGITKLGVSFVYFFK